MCPLAAQLNMQTYTHIQKKKKEIAWFFCMLISLYTKRTFVHKKQEIQYPLHKGVRHLLFTTYLHVLPKVVQSLKINHKSLKVHPQTYIQNNQMLLVMQGQ